MSHQRGTGHAYAVNTDRPWPPTWLAHSLGLPVLLPKMRVTGTGEIMKCQNGNKSSRAGSSSAVSHNQPAGPGLGPFLWKFLTTLPTGELATAAEISVNASREQLLANSISREPRGKWGSLVGRRGDLKAAHLLGAAGACFSSNSHR